MIRSLIGRLIFELRLQRASGYQYQEHYQVREYVETHSGLYFACLQPHFCCGAKRGWARRIFVTHKDRNETRFFEGLVTKNPVW